MVVARATIGSDSHLRQWDDRGKRAPIGRLGPGVTLEQATVELNTIAAELAQSYPATNRTIGVKLTAMREALVGQLRPTLLLRRAVQVSRQRP